MKTFPIIVRQNVDRNVRARDYDHLVDQLLVTTIFRTVQGEAPFMGYPAVFLRLAGCNFGAKLEAGACKWCDTSFQFDKGTAYTYGTLNQALAAVAKYGDILVITGGEPTLQANLAPFVKHVLTMGLFKQVQIETNGTQPQFIKAARELKIPLSSSVDVDGLYMVVSPKGIYKAGTIPEPSTTMLEAAGCLKFVLEANPDSPHHRLPNWAFRARNAWNTPLYVSPMTVYRRPYAGEVSSIWDNELINQEATAANYAYAATYAIEHNLRISVQMHTFLAVA